MQILQVSELVTKPIYLITSRQIVTKHCTKIMTMRMKCSSTIISSGSCSSGPYFSSRAVVREVATNTDISFLRCCILQQTKNCKMQMSRKYLNTTRCDATRTNERTNRRTNERTNTEKCCKSLNTLC